jgi:hypothetical protein
MNKDQTSPKQSVRAWILYSFAIIVILLIISLVVESCDSEKIEICDTATGECALESSCRPLLFDLFT